MLSKQRINVLHISDLHYDANRSYDQDRVLQAFLNDLEKISNTEMKPDIAVFSGDLVNNGDCFRSYSGVLDNVIMPIMEIANLDENYIFIAAGNHDVQRTAVKSDRNTYDGILENLVDRDSLNSHYFSRNDTSLIQKKFHNFFKFREMLDNNNLVYEDHYIESYYVREIDLPIICLNTSWLSVGGLFDINDQGRLMIPEAALATQIAKLPSSRPLIVIGHHPLNWFAEHVTSDIGSLLNRNQLIYLHGHLHKPISSQTSTTMGRSFTHQSGALFCGRSQENGYAILSIAPNLGHTEVNLRTYYDGRSSFDQAVNVTPKGRWYPSAEDEQFWANLAPPVDTQKIGAWASKHVKADIQERMDDGFPDRPISELFVPPRLSERNAASALSQEEEEQSYISVTEICQSQNNYIISGKREYGKTTLLRHIALSLIDECNKAQPVVPCLIDFADVKFGSGRFERLIRSQLPEIKQEQFSFEDILKKGYLVLLIDDFDFSNEKIHNVIMNFIKQFPMIRIILTTSIQAHRDLGLAYSPNETVPFVSLYMEPFNRREMRKLVERWNDRPSQEVETLLDRIVSNVVHMNVPLTAVNGTILLTIYDSHGDVSPINKFVLIEMFVEILLQKASPHHAKRKQFDFRNQVHLLSYIAMKMVYDNKYVYSMEDLIINTKEYFSKFGLPFQAIDQIENFITAKILINKDGMISFRYRAFLEYFTSLRMNEDDEFREFILDNDNYLSFLNEIEYYSGIGRNNIDMLDLIEHRFKLLDDKIDVETEWSIDLDLINNFKLPDKDLNNDWYDEIEQQIHAPQQSPEERDRLLESELPRDVDDRQEVYRPIFSGAGDRWSACLLMYSAVLRNSELISESKKRHHINNVLRAWSKFTYHSLLLVPQLVKHRKLVLNGVVYYVFFPRDWSDDKVARGLYTGLPRALSEMIGFYLATEKMELQLKKPLADERDEPLIVKFYRSCLYGDMRLDGFQDLLSSTAQELRSSHFLTQAFMWKIYHMLGRLPLTSEEDKGVRHLLAKIVGNAHPGSQSEKNRRISDEHEKLRKSRLVGQLRLLAQERSKTGS